MIRLSMHSCSVFTVHPIVLAQRDISVPASISVRPEARTGPTYYNYGIQYFRTLILFVYQVSPNHLRPE